MHSAKLLFCLLPALAGCGGQYILTAPDYIALAGSEAPVVVRLQRSEFYRVAASVVDAPLQFRIAGGDERVAYSDSLGYVGTTVSAPARPGKYRLSITYQDYEGDVLAGELALYAWLADRAVVAVDLDGLPPPGVAQTEAAWSALSVIARGANILYLTRRPVAEHQQIHADMRKAGYPDGPVLLWQRERWHITRTGPYKLPKVIVETRLVSQLEELRRVFPRLEVGVCTSELAAKALADAGLRCVVVGSGGEGLLNVMRHESWGELADRGI